MKKLFTLAVSTVLAMGITTSAKCYVIGYVNGAGFDPNNGVELTETSTPGVYSGEVTLDPSAATSSVNYFGLATELVPADATLPDGFNDRWTYFNSELRCNPASKDYPVVLDESMTFTKGGKDNSWKINAGTYTFTVDMNANTLVVSGQEVPDKPIIGYGVIGAFGTWEIENTVELVADETAEGVYSADFTDFTGEFIVVGKTEDGFTYDKKWAAESDVEGANVLTNDTPFTLTAQGDANLMYEASANVNITLTVADDVYTLVVKEQTGAIESVDVEDDATVTVYNFAGIKILDNADKSALRTLPEGLYIVNGKKQIVK